MSRSESLSAVAETGDRPATLRALRDVLARQIETCNSSRDVAALSRQLTDVLNQLASLPAPAEGTPLDELKKRRVDRRAGAAGKTRAAVSR